MSEPTTTWILHNWAKQDNMRRVIASLKEQTAGCRIFLWNNNPKAWVDKRVDWVVNSSRNAHLGSYFYLASQADTPFVGRIDDDLVFTDPKVLADAIAAFEQHQLTERQIVGSQGVILTSRNYEVCRHVHADHLQDNAPVDIVKGRLMLMRREATALVNWNPGTVHIDLTMCFDLAGKSRHTHYVLSTFRRRLKNLPERGTDTYSTKPGHHAARAALANAWVDSF